MGKSVEGCGRGSCRCPCWQASLITYCRSSAASTKSKGDKGSPCLTPLLQWNCFPGTPLSRMEEKPEEKITLIQFNHKSGKPSWAIMLNMVECSTVSKALAKSNFRMIICLLLWWHWWMNSKIQAKQSCMVLPLMKQYWFACKNSNCWCKIYTPSLREPFAKPRLQFPRTKACQSVWPFNWQGQRGSAHQADLILAPAAIAAQQNKAW